MTEMKTTAQPRTIGRPRDERADRAILRATLELMAETGAHELRMDDVARRAGVGKATIYRRYRSKGELITAAIAGLVSEITIPDTGATRTDLRALMRGAVEVYRDPGSSEARRGDDVVWPHRSQGAVPRNRYDVTSWRL